MTGLAPEATEHRTLTSPARVRSVDAVGLACLERSVGSCARCASGGGCGMGLAGSGATVRLPDECGVQPGDPVEVAWPARAMVATAARVYALPLGGFLGGMLVAASVPVGAPGTWAADAWLALCGMLGGVAGAAVSRRSELRHHDGGAVQGWVRYEDRPRIRPRANGTGGDPVGRGFQNRTVDDDD